MIGIYKITNKLNGKIYIGQSNNIERRFKEHCAPARIKISNSPIDIAINKYGKENFCFEVLEECSIDKLNELETFWILELDSITHGYNCNIGGNQASIGSNNPRAKLTEDDVIIIRTAYKNHERQKEIYEQFKDKISWGSFQAIWQGKSWKHIMPEVLTEENKFYYSRQATNGEKSSKAILSDQEVIKIRTRYVTETAKQIYEDYKDILKYQTLQQILWGRAYSHLPVYSKKKKEWIIK